MMRWNEQTHRFSNIQYGVALTSVTSENAAQELAVDDSFSTDEEGKSLSVKTFSLIHTGRRGS